MNIDLTKIPERFVQDIETLSKFMKKNSATDEKTAACAFARLTSLVLGSASTLLGVFSVVAVTSGSSIGLGILGVALAVLGSVLAHDIYKTTSNILNPEDLVTLKTAKNALSRFFQIGKKLFNGTTTIQNELQKLKPSLINTQGTIIFNRVLTAYYEFEAKSQAELNQ